jgi:hypothetical protein
MSDAVPTYTNEFIKDPFKTAFTPIIFVGILCILETTYFLLLSVYHNNAGIYAQFHAKINWKAMRGGLGEIAGWMKARMDVESTPVVLTPGGGQESASIINEASLPPPYMVSLRCFMFI